MNKVFIGLGIAALVVVAFFAGMQFANRPLGAASGPTFTERLHFMDGVVTGGRVATISTTSATYTLTAGEYRSSLVNVAATDKGAAITVTLPATNTKAYGERVGDTTEFLLKNSHTAAGTTTTIAAGAGVDLQEPDGQNVVIGITNYAYIICKVLPLFDVACIVDETIPAD